jgi:hypothetical protein
LSILADLLGHGLDDVDGRVTLEPVVVGLVLPSFWNFSSNALTSGSGASPTGHVRDRAVGGVAGELDHLLPGEGRFADYRLVVALLSELAQHAPRLVLVEVDEQRIAFACFALSTGLEKSTWPGSVEMSAATLMPWRPSAFTMTSRPPLPKSLFTHITATDLRLDGVLEVAGDLRHRVGLRERCAEDVRIACCVMLAASPP